MMAYRFLLPGFLLLILAATPAWAQTPPVANAPAPGADFLRTGGDPVPDTTAPWRYFPLAVGNAWEYYNYFTGERRRADVYGTETHNGREYFSFVSFVYDSNGQNGIPDFGRPLRYDTTTAAVWSYVHQTNGERPYLKARCPLDAPFGSETECLLGGGKPFEVGGGYEGLLAFGEPFPGTGEDTVRTAVKTYISDWNPGIYYDYRYAADIGFVYYDDKFVREGLYYARVDGVEYGVSVLPPFTVDAEAAPLEPTAGLMLSAYPNPFRSQLTVAVAVKEPESVEVELLDVLGRVVKRQEVGWAGSGREVLRIDGRDLGAGAYLVRAVVDGAPVAVAVRPVTRLR